MLTKFSVKNYKQFKDEIVFDLSAGNYSFNEECVKDKTVKTALIYGENATGKSNLGLAMYDLVAHLTDNLSIHLQNSHFLNAYSELSYCTFSFDFMFGYRGKKFKVNYSYSKNKSSDLMSESFSIENDNIISFEKGFPFEVKLHGTEHLNKHLNPNQNLSVLKYIFSNTNLDKRNKNNCLFIEFMNYINSILWFRNVPDNLGYIGNKTGRYNIFTSILENNNLEDFELFLNNSGIYCALTTTESDGEKTVAFKMGDKKIPFYTIASTGTKNLALFYFWWQEIKTNKIPLLFIDEFDASYHFNLSVNIVEKLKELPNTQVILTTHNTALLDNDLIRPDCGFIIDGKQIKALQHCTKKELRMAHNLEKMYRAGGFNV